MKARISNLTFGRDGESYLTLTTTENVMSLYDELHDKDLNVQFKKWRKSRSLSANAYAWALMNQLAERTGVPVRDIYRRAVKDIGGNSDIVCVQNKAVEKLRETWEKNGLGYQSEIMDSKLDGCTLVVLYYGSSTYDTAQMSRLIDVIVEDCKAVGIETKDPFEVDSMLEHWRNHSDMQL